jgi:hypothetical protein
MAVCFKMENGKWGRFWQAPVPMELAAKIYRNSRLTTKIRKMGGFTEPPSQHQIR